MHPLFLMPSVKYECWNSVSLHHCYQESTHHLCCVSWSSGKWKLHIKKPRSNTFPKTSLPQDITSLLHTIYEVVDASVNHSPGSSKTLRVKLSVAPDSSQRWRSCTQGAAGKSRINAVGGGCRRREGILGSPLCCLLSAQPEMCLLSRRKAAASGLSELCSSQSQSRSISPTQWGSFLMMGGVTEPREGPLPQRLQILWKKP